MRTGSLKVLVVTALLLPLPALAAAPNHVPAIPDDTSAMPGDDSNDLTPPPKAPTPMNAGRNVKTELIEIVRATYGGTRRWDSCDATQSVRLLCDNRNTCSVPAQDSLCTTPQALPKLIPRLEIMYRCTQSQHSRTSGVDKPFAVHLSCDVSAQR